MELAFIVSEKYIRLNDEAFGNIQEDLSWVPSNVHAVIWNDTVGRIEYKNAPSEVIDELGIYEQALEMFDAEKQRRFREQLAEEELREASRDYWKEFRNERNRKLIECDWTQLSDSPITKQKKQEWAVYRQALRDLPENTNDPKNPEWPSSPSS
jgi:hypothetical protein